MLSELFTLFYSSKFEQIFGISIVIFALSTVFKYLGMSQRFRGNRRETNFECLRSGIDVAIIGITTQVATLSLAFESVLETTYSTQSIFTCFAVVILMQTCLLGLAAFFTAVFDSHESQFGRGVLLPHLCGWSALLLSVGTYILLFEHLI